jgi:hypothetical protein
MTAADFYAKSTTAIENKNGCLLMVDYGCRGSRKYRHIADSQLQPWMSGLEHADWLRQ